MEKKCNSIVSDLVLLNEIMNVSIDALKFQPHKNHTYRPEIRDKLLNFSVTT